MGKILIIDDDDQLRRSFKKLLTEEDYTVESAPSGEIGVQKIQTDPPEVVVLDIRLPGMNGLDLHQTEKSGKHKTRSTSSKNVQE